MNFRKSLAWSFGQETVTFVLQFIGSIIMARLLTPAEFGVFALAMAASYLLSSFRNFGIGSYLIREKELTADKIATAFTLWICLSWSLGLMVLLARGPIAAAYGEPGIADVLLVLSGSFFITPLGQPTNSLLMREMRFDLLHHINLLSTLCGLGTSIGLAMHGHSYMSMAWGLLVDTLVRALALLWIKRRQVSLRLSLAHWREVMQFGGYLTAASFLGELNQHGIKFIVGALINPTAVALLERAVQIPNLVRQTIFRPLGPVLFPKFAEDIRQGRSIGPAVEKVVAFTSVLVIPTFLVIALCAESIVVLLFGDNWRVAGELLPWFLLSNAILTLLPQPHQILVPHGQVKRLFKLSSLGVLNNIILTAIGAWYGLEVFAMTRPVETIIFIILSFFAIRQFWGCNLDRLIPLYLKAMLLAFFCAIPALIAVYYYGPNLNWTVLSSIAACSTLFWLVGIFVLKHPLCIELKLIFKKL
tara:strand:- start:28807 stop:30228 length:1422 start_codon:yes stop_codon:yes gene_type:complete